MEQTVYGRSLPRRLPPPCLREEAEKLDDRALLELYKETGEPGSEVDAGAALYGAGAPNRLQASGLYSSFAQLDDIVQEGLLVLLKAVDKFDPGQECQV
ncbi:MAG: sigma factor [Dysosmobacter sp.]